jgi:predicted PurR-regulated permease PerM
METLTEGKWLRRLILAALLATLALLAFQVLQPFIVPVIWSAILAYVSWPLHARLVRVFRGQRDAAAFVMTLLLAIAIILPIVWLVILVQTEALPVYREVAPLLARTELPAFVTQLPLLGPRIQEWFAEWARNPEALGKALEGFFAQSSGELSAVVGGVGAAWWVLGAADDDDGPGASSTETETETDTETETETQTETEASP